MIDTYYRGTYQSFFVNPLVKKLLPFKQITPTTITVMACLSGILVPPLLTMNYPISAIFMMLLSGYLDSVDGSLARESQSSTEFGAVLDIVSDRIVEFAIILGLFFVDPSSRGLLCLFMLGSVLICVSSFLVVGIFIENSTHKSFHYSPGLMERSEAFTLFTLMILFPSYFPIFSILFTFLVFYTAFIRVKDFKRNE
jgi:archaetidylinositol phosphate synthase